MPLSLKSFPSWRSRRLKTALRNSKKRNFRLCIDAPVNGARAFLRLLCIHPRIRIHRTTAPWLSSRRSLHPYSQGIYICIYPLFRTRPTLRCYNLILAKSETAFARALIKKMYTWRRGVVEFFLFLKSTFERVQKVSGFSSMKKSTNKNATTKSANVSAGLTGVWGVYHVDIISSRRARIKPNKGTGRRRADTI